MANINHHWNYFLSIEKDLENLTRYIEFSQDNNSTYSTELTYILLSVSSEIDVIMKQLCNLIDPTQNAENINNYKDIIRTNLSDFINEEVFIDRYGLVYKPFFDWDTNANPYWWTSYNKVKHERNTHYREANLENVLNAVSGLLLTVLYYYKYYFSSTQGKVFSIKDTTYELEPKSTLLTLEKSYYYQVLVCD